MKIFEHLTLDITKISNDETNFFFLLRRFILWAGIQKSSHYVLVYVMGQMSHVTDKIKETDIDWYGSVWGTSRVATTANTAFRSS